jgi:hypothetical protein
MRAGTWGSIIAELLKPPILLLCFRYQATTNPEDCVAPTLIWGDL